MSVQGSVRPSRQQVSRITHTATQQMRALRGSDDAVMVDEDADDYVDVNNDWQRRHRRALSSTRTPDGVAHRVTLQCCFLWLLAAEEALSQTHPDKQTKVLQIRSSQTSRTTVNVSYDRTHLRRRVEHG